MILQSISLMCFDTLWCSLWSVWCDMGYPFVGAWSGCTQNAGADNRDKPRRQVTWETARAHWPSLQISWYEAKQVVSITHTHTQSQSTVYKVCLSAHPHMLYRYTTVHPHIHTELLCIAVTWSCDSKQTRNNDCVNTQLTRCVAITRYGSNSCMEVIAH